MGTYTKPYTYVNGTIIDATGHNNNEQSARVWCNDEIVPTDIKDNSLDRTDLGAYRYYAPNEEFDGFSKTIGGTINTTTFINRAYFTTTAKTNRMSVKNVRNWQAIPNASYEVSVDRSNAYFFITGYLKAHTNANLTGIIGGNGQHILSNEIKLQIEDLDAGIQGVSDQTGDFVFGANGTYDPTQSDYDAGAGGTAASDRSITFSYYGLINGKGRKRFSIVVDPKQEIGYITAKTFVVEVFYI